jgi:hypothetical protein
VKLTAQEWEKADATVREQLQADYKREMVDFLAAQVKYDQMLTSEQHEEIKKAKKDIAESKEKRVLKKVMSLCGGTSKYISKNFASVMMFNIFLVF